MAGGEWIALAGVAVIVVGGLLGLAVQIGRASAKLDGLKAAVAKIENNHLPHLSENIEKLFHLHDEVRVDCVDHLQRTTKCETRLETLDT